MHPNLFINAIGKIKSNLQSTSNKHTKPEPERPPSDILSRIKKPIQSSSELVIKDQIGGREERQQKRTPFPSNFDAIKKALGDRFIPKAKIVNERWQHDLCPVQEKPKHKVFVRGLPMNIESKILEKLFEKYGEITGIYVVKETAEIYFLTKFSAQKAAVETGPVEGKRIKVIYCEDQKTHKLEEKKKAEDLKPTLEADRVKDPKSILSRIKRP